MGILKKYQNKNKLSEGVIMKKIIIPVLITLLFLAGCSTLVLKPANYEWPVESVIKVDNDGFVIEKRYSLSFDVKELFLAETNDSSGYLGKELRVIRNDKGYYFMAADNFKNVYVFKTGEGSLILSNKILLSNDQGINNPSFNQRPPYIELNYDNNKKVYLTNEGQKEEGKK